jgi:ABC-2 type transport system ATP-binding protein
VTEVHSLEGGRFALTSAEVDVRPEIFRFAADHSLSLIGLQQEENSLETIFHTLTAGSATPNAEK